MASLMQASRKEETVRRILAGALEVFSTEGYSGASVDDIARRAGVNKATIYYHLGDKESLYGQVLHQVISSTMARIRKGVESAGSPEEKLLAYVRGISESVEGHPPLPPMMMRAVAQKGENLPAEVAGDLVAVYGMLADILEEGRASGAFRESNALLVYLMILSTVALHKNVLVTWADSSSLAEMFLALNPSLFEQVARGLSVNAADEVAAMILRAVKETPGLS